jgi:hypothetical protein
MRVVVSGLLALAVGACSVSELLPSAPADPAGPEPAYRSIIAGQIAGLIGDPSKAGLVQISNVRRVEFSFKGASWLACLKLSTGALPRYYAVFIQNNKIVDSRLSVLLDQCELQSFGPFDWAAEAKEPER